MNKERAINVLLDFAKNHDKDWYAADKDGLTAAIIFLEQKMYLSIRILVTVYLEKTTIQNFHPGLQMGHYQLDTFTISLWNMKMI